MAQNPKPTRQKRKRRLKNFMVGVVQRLEAKSPGIVEKTFKMLAEAEQ